MTTNVICTDGTVIECAEFEAIESGVLLYFAAADVDAEDDRDVELTPGAFVPIQAIRYVLPADIEVRPPPGTHPAQAPPAGQATHQQSGTGGPPPGSRPTGPGAPPTASGTPPTDPGAPPTNPGTPPGGDGGRRGEHRPSPSGGAGPRGEPPGRQ